MRKRVRKFECVACKKWEQRCDLNLFVPEEYDFSNNVVKTVFGEAILENKKIQYVCNPCKSGLSQQNGKDPYLPKVFEKAGEVKNRTYLCTCCHGELKENQVYKFRRFRYDFSNPIVEECLHCDVRKKNSMYEYICKQCHICLRRKKGDSLPTRPPNAVGKTVTRSDEWNEARWISILKRMKTITTYDVLQRYVEELDFPDITAVRGNVHLPGYDRDCLALKLLPDDSPYERDSLFPVYTKGDGNCLLYSMSRVVYGNESHGNEMRVRIVCEGIRNSDLYLDDNYLARAYNFPYHDSQSLVEMYCTYGHHYRQGMDLNDVNVVKELYRQEMLSVRRDFIECGIWQLHQAANVLRTPVYTMFPHIALRQLRADFNRLILPAEDNYLMDEPIIIMWTKSSEKSNRYGHFVPVVKWNKTLHWNDRNVWKDMVLIDNMENVHSQKHPQKSIGFKCTCCHQCFDEGNFVLKFDRQMYNFENPVVREALRSDVRCKSNSGIEYICRSCHVKLRKDRSSLPSMPKNAAAGKDVGIEQKKKVQCTVCHYFFTHGRYVKLFDMSKYNFEDDIVKEALHDDVRCQGDGDEEYICRPCNECLTREKPCMPRTAFCKRCKDSGGNEEEKMWKDQVKAAGEKFEKCNGEFMNYVCTVCHRRLFRKSVKDFSVQKYDMRNEDVQITLSERFRYKNKDGCEHICQTCHGKLLKGKMPSQAVANQLELPDIPEEFEGLTRLEVRCISKRIPFMSLQALRKGGQGKINGPCINVPATLEPITTQVLPRIPEDAHVILLKLKRMIVYKTDYLYDHINPQRVMSVLRWLKKNNPYYRDISVDEDWPDKISGHVLCDSVHDKMKKEENMEVDAVDGEEENMEVDGPDGECHDATNQRDKDTLQEEQMELNRRAGITVEPSSTCVQIDDLEGLAFAIAPGQGSIPKYILLDADFEILAFPQFFPGGFGGYETLTPRRSSLDMRRYINQRLLNVDPRFSRNAEYIFAFQYATEIKQLRTDMQMALRRTRGSGDLGAINAGNLQSMEFRTQLLYTDNAYHFMGNVRGTPAYWQKNLYDVLAMLRSLGTPTWFLTLSPAEFRWPDFLQAVGITYGQEWSVDEVLVMDWGTKAKYLRENPVTTCEMFEKRVDDFFREFLCSEARPLGHIVHRCEKIEFQVRGSPHAHCLLWIKDAPKVDRESDEEVCRFVDKYISGAIPAQEKEEDDVVRQLVIELQRHSHSLACRKHINEICRFKFPRPPCMKTIVSRQPSPDEEVTLDRKENAHILQSVREGIEKHPDWRIDEILVNECISEEQYIQCLETASRSGTEVILKRDVCDMNINNYNYDCLKYWKANMDIQYIGNPYACITYVLSYVMKAEKGMSELLREVSKQYANEEIREQMKKVASSFLNKREVSIQESVMRVLGLWLFKKNKTVVYVHNGPKVSRPRVPLPQYKLQNMADDDENVFYKNWHDRYASRPDSLEAMCLAEFVVWYVVVYGDVKSGNSIIELKNRMGKMRKREEKALLRCHMFKENTEEYFYSKLLLFLPWRNENEEMLKGYSSYREHYNHVIDVVEVNAREYNLHVRDIDRALEEFRNSPPEMSEWLSAGTKEDEIRKEHVGEENINAEEGEKKEKKDLKSPLSLKYKAEALKKTVTSQEYRKMLRGLNKEQREIVMFNRHWVKESIWRMKLGLKVQPYKVFVSGPGGTGKSHVILLIFRDVVHLFRLSKVLEKSSSYLCRKNLEEEVIALLTAFTGTASFNIGGTTLHQAFQFGQDKQGQENLPDDKKTAMVTRLELLQHVTIDEVSMVSAKNLALINARCSQAKKCVIAEQEFGNTSILAVGDLYQLPPVKGAFPFMPYDGPLRFNEPIWHKFYLHELVTIMRQKDREFAELLNKIRTATPALGSDEDNKLRDRELKIGEDDPMYPTYALHVYARNEHANARNERILSGLDSHLYICKAKDIVQDRNITIDQIVMPKKPGDTGNLRETLLIKVGARVVITTNVDVTDGLTNGAYGEVKHIVPKKHKDSNGKEYESNEVHAVLVQFDNERAGVKAKQQSPYKDKYALCVPIYRVEISFLVRGRKTVNVTRRNFPLALAWAVTIHKTQGQTVDAIVVDMELAKGKFSAGQAYVAFSRVTTYDKLYILNYTRSQIHANPDVENEMRRLRKHKLPKLKAPLITYIEGPYLRVGHLNVQGLGVGSHSKFPDLVNDDNVQQLDVLCLTETHLRAGTSFEATSVWAEKNGSVFQYNRAGEEGGGIAVLVSDKYKCRERKVNIEGQRCVEVVAVEIVGEPNTVIVAVYIRPQAEKKACVNIIKSVVNSIVEGGYERIIITGDINEDLLITDKCHHVRDFLLGSGFDQHISLPTTDYASLLDHVYTRGGTNVKCDVTDTYYSDHDMVFCFLC